MNTKAMIMHGVPNYFHSILRTVSADTPDAVIDRQLRELKQQLPRMLVGVAVCSAIVSFYFLEKAATTILICNGLYLAYLIVRVPSWLSLNIDAMTASKKRRHINTVMPVLVGLGTVCSGIAIYLSNFADVNGFILLAVWCAFCGIGSSIALTAIPRAATTAMILTIAPFSVAMLASGNQLLMTFAGILICAMVINHYQCAHAGSVLAKLAVREQEIKKSAESANENFRNFIESASDWAWERNAEGKLVYLSSSFEAVTGQSVEEILRSGANTLLEMSPDEQSDVLEQLTSAFNDRLPIRDIRYTVPTPDGEPITVSTSGLPRYNDDGEFTGYIGWTRDITIQTNAERRLIESEERHRDFAESAGDWAWEVDAEMRYTYFSERASTVTGLDHQQFLGSRMTFADNGASVFQWRELQRTIGERKAFSGFISRVDRPDAPPIWIERNAKPVFDEAGAFKGYRGVAREVTARIEAKNEAAEARRQLELNNAKLEGMVRTRTAEFQNKSSLLEEVLESMAQGVAVIDENYTIIETNETAWKTSGLPQGLWMDGADIRRPLEIGIRHGLYEYTSVEEFFDACYKTISQGSSFKAIRRQTDGTIIEENIVSRPSGGIVVTYSDITEAQSREDELRDLSEDLRESRDAAEAANRAKSEFLANMSHEIRTPMNGVVGMASLLLDTAMTEKQQDMAKVIVSSGDALLKIINDILDFSRLEAGKLQLVKEPFDLRATIEDVASLLALRIEEKGLELMVRYQPDLGDCYIGDPGRVRQIVTNLIGNAVKFTETGYVLVDISGKRRGEVADLTISVTDTGCGIPKNKTQAVFEEFEQVDGSAVRRHDGAGLGLAISKKMIEALGGEISVISEVDQGSTFTIRIPMAIDETASNIIQPPEAVFEDMRALIVDDNEVNRIILREQLGSWGLSSDAFENAADAFAAVTSAAADNKPYTIAILDFQMPGDDGMSLARRIKSNEAVAATPLILLTSAGRKGDPAGLAGDLFSAYLVKPARASMLLDSILTALNDGAVAKLRSAAATTITESSTSTCAFTSDGSPLRVLVAEDNIVNQMVVKAMLEKLNCDVSIASNGKVAVNKYQADGADVVLMDISMPEMDGIEATSIIRTEQEMQDKHVPVIGVTAHAMEEDRQRCLDAGMDDYLPKPIKQDVLQDMLEKWSADAGAKSATA